MFNDKIGSFEEVYSASEAAANCAWLHSSIHFQLKMIFNWFLRPERNVLYFYVHLIAVILKSSILFIHFSSANKSNRTFSMFNERLANIFLSCVRPSFSSETGVEKCSKLNSFVR